MIRALWWLFWRRDSESAACAVICIAQFMRPRHLRELADYLCGLADDREYQSRATMYD